MKPGDKVLIRARVLELGITQTRLFIGHTAYTWIPNHELEPDGTDETAVALAAARAEIRDLKERLQEATRAYQNLAGWSAV